MTCAFCGDCPFIDPNIPGDLHEIHITVSSPENLTVFKDMCDYLGIKPVFLDLNNVMIDVMTTSRYRGKETDAQRHAEWIADQIEYHGFNVVRTKIETTLTNQIAQVCAHGNYYESHFALSMKASEKPYLRKVIEMMEVVNLRVHISNNMFKPDVQMLTFRSYQGELRWHMNKVNFIKFTLEDENFNVIKVINEYCWYDTNVKHDEEWINGR